MFAPKNEITFNFNERVTGKGETPLKSYLPFPKIVLVMLDSFRILFQIWNRNSFFFINTLRGVEE